MSDKPKRKNHYHRWYAFRGLLLALIAFLGVIGYFLTRDPEPDSESIIYFADGQLWRVSILADSVPQQLTDEPYSRALISFDISRDSRWLVYEFNGQLKLMNLQTYGIENVIDCGAVNLRCSQLDLHPTQLRVLAHKSGVNTDNGYDQIWQLNLENGQQEMITEAQTIGQTDYWWLGDGSQITYRTNFRGFYHIYNLNSDMTIPIEHRNVIFHPDGEQIIYADDTSGCPQTLFLSGIHSDEDANQVRLWDCVTEKLPPFLLGSNGEWLIVLYSNQDFESEYVHTTIRLKNLLTPSESKQIELVDGAISACAVHPQNRLVACSGQVINSYRSAEERPASVIYIYDLSLADSPLITSIQIDGYTDFVWAD
jgi:hypothetical protein